MVKLTDVTGIGPVTAKLLSEHNIRTVEALASISLVELKKIPGFSDIRAQTAKKAASDCLQGKTGKNLTTATSNAKTAIKRTAAKKIVTSKAMSPVEAGNKAKDKTKNKKDAKKKEKMKGKDEKKDKSKKKSSKGKKAKKKS